MRRATFGILVVTLFGALLIRMTHAEETPALWQTSWAKFIEALVPEIGLNPFDPGVKAKFGGKTVTWEGTLGAIRDAKTRIRVDMAPNVYKGTKFTSLQLFCKAGNLPKWKDVPIGSRVRFRAVLDDPVTISLRFGGPSEEPSVLVFVKDAELLAATPKAAK